MNRSLIFITALLLLAFQSYAQEEERLKRLTVLQSQLNQVQAKSDEPVDSLKASISHLKTERDSLQLLVKLLNAELLLTRSKLTREKQLNATALADTAILHGYFVVIESERSETEAQQKLHYLQKKLPGRPLVIVRNQHKSWYHICITGKYNRGNIGSAVKEARSTGIEDAWWISL